MTIPGEPATTPQFIAEPYERDPRAGRERLRGLLVLATVSGFCLFYGFAFALLAPALLLPLVVPLPVLAMVAIWALPEIRAVPTRTLTALTFAFFVGLVMWPNYLALALPGLPWITMVRITGFPLVLTLLICVSVSSAFRARLAASLNAEPLIWKGLVCFVALQFVSIGLSDSIGFSIDRFVVAQVSWTAIFFVSAYLFLVPGRAERMFMMLWAMVIPVGIIGVFEWRDQHVLWAGHIPSFLQIDDPSVQQTLTPKYRVGAEGYRTHSTFNTSLGLGEYLALTLPFIIHVAASNYKWALRSAAVATIPFLMFIVYISGSRLSVVGCMMSFLLYAIAWSLMYWRSNRQSILAPAFVLAVPPGLVTALTLVLFWGRLHDAAFGGNGGTASSTAARQQQLALAIPKFLAHPWGYGIGNGAKTVGFTIQNGVMTLDSYYITIAIEYGAIGFLLYYGWIALCVFRAAKNTSLTIGKERELTLLIPLAIALTNFFVIKAVFSAEDNHAIIFMFIGMITALIARAKGKVPNTALPNRRRSEPLGRSSR
jgi:hypothetical protein